MKIAEEKKRAADTKLKTTGRSFSDKNRTSTENTYESRAALCVNVERSLLKITAH